MEENENVKRISLFTLFTSYKKNDIFYLIAFSRMEAFFTDGVLEQYEASQLRLVRYLVK